MSKRGHTGATKEVLEKIANELLDEISLGLCFELHRSCKIGTLFLEDIDDEGQKLYEICHIKGRDVFGQAPNTKKQYDCVCPNCDRSLAAARFAPHLEKCMGMGTSGTRVASRRVARSVNKRGTDVETDDNSNDGDWKYGGGSKGGKKSKKDKRVVTPKRSSASQKSGGGEGVDERSRTLKRLSSSDDLREELTASNTRDSSDSSSTPTGVKPSKKHDHSKLSAKRKLSTGSHASYSSFVT